MNNQIYAKKIVADIESLYLTSEDICHFGLVTMKAIGKTRKEWICNYSGKLIPVGSSTVRSFRPDGRGGFEKLYWDLDALYSLYKECLIDVADLNAHEDAYEAAFAGTFGYKSD